MSTHATSLGQFIIELLGRDALVLTLGVAIAVVVLGLKHILDFVLVLTGKKKLPNPDNYITHKEFKAMTEQNAREHGEMKTAVSKLSDTLIAVAKDMAVMTKEVEILKEHIDVLAEKVGNAINGK